MHYLLIQIHFVFRDDTEHYFNDDEEPVSGNEPPTGCVYETTGGIPCQPEFTYSGKKNGQWHGSCAPGSWPSGPWCYDIRGGGYWDRCKVDSDSNPTCSKALNDMTMTI